MPSDVEKRLAALGLSLPAAPAPVANYVPYLIAGDQLFISGQISKAGDGRVSDRNAWRRARCGGGQDAARLCALNILAQAKAALGDLGACRAGHAADWVRCVNAGLHRSALVINGASDLMVAALGDAGRHTRAAVGVASLPLGAAVEIDAILRFK